MVLDKQKIIEHPARISQQQNFLRMVDRVSWKHFIKLLFPYGRKKLCPKNGALASYVLYLKKEISWSVRITDTLHYSVQETESFLALFWIA
jgi:hypothetical protein